jgi:hypothetical protein
MEDLYKVAERELRLSDFQVHNSFLYTIFPPFSEWREGKVLTWWSAYNSVKHHRVRDFKLATLENCFNAMAGLYVVNLYQEHKALMDALLSPESQLFSPLLKGIRRRFEGVAGYKLPHCEKLK